MEWIVLLFFIGTTDIPTIARVNSKAACEDIVREASKGRLSGMCIYDPVSR